MARTPLPRLASLGWLARWSGGPSASLAIGFAPMRSSSSALAAAVLTILVLAGCGGSTQTTADSASAPNRAVQLPARRQHHDEVREARASQEAQALLAEERAMRERRKAAARRRARARAAQTAASGIAPLTEKLYQQTTGIDRGNFQIAYEVCGSQPMSQSAEEWETSDDPSSIAHAYGLEYDEYARAAVEEGCLRAFLDSHAQWEAELEAHSKL